VKNRESRKNGSQSNTEDIISHDRFSRLRNLATVRQVPVVCQVQTKRKQIRKVIYEFRRIE
jgi:hypothetical protein